MEDKSTGEKEDASMAMAKGGGGGGEDREEREVLEVPEGWKHEASLAGEWGMGRGELAEYRRVYMREGYHWGKLGGARQIFFTKEGVELARGHFRPPSEEELYARKVMEKRRALGEWAYPPLPGTALSETVCRVVRGGGNPRMIRVVNGSGKVVMVRVKSALNFRVGMLVDLGSCRIMYEEPDGHSMRSTRGHNSGEKHGRPLMYELMIPLPRYVGRWGYSILTPEYMGRSASYYKRVAPGVERTHFGGWVTRVRK